MNPLAIIAGALLMVAGAVTILGGLDPPNRMPKITTDVRGKGIDKTILVFDPSGPRTVQIGDLVLTNVTWYRLKENVGKPFDYELRGGRP